MNSNKNYNSQKINKISIPQLIRFKSINLQLLQALKPNHNPLMNTQLIQTNQSIHEKFEKYPKNYQENQHYKSVKQKLMTAEDDQEIIKFPYTTTSLQSKKSSKQHSPASTARKVQKYKGKRFQTVPLRTISYCNPPDHTKTQQFSQSSNTSRKSESENKFASKNIFTNMKKLNDLRKKNYKSKIKSIQRQQNPQKTPDSDDKLDLFRLTSTNFKYKERMFSDSPQDVEFLRKLTQTQGASRNVIKYQKPQNSLQKDQIYQEQKSPQETIDKKDTQSQCFVLYPVKTQQDKSVEKPKSKKLIQTASAQSILSKHKMSDSIVRNSIDSEKVNHQNPITFVRYSESTIETENEVLRHGIAKLRSINLQKNEYPFKKSDFQHIPHSFKASFRVKHIEDNKNILLNTIKKKANVMDRNQLVDYLKKVVK